MCKVIELHEYFLCYDFLCFFIVVYCDIWIIRGVLLTNRWTETEQCQWMKEGQHNCSWALCFLFQTTHWTSSFSLPHLSHVDTELPAHAAGWVNRVCLLMTAPHIISQHLLPQNGCRCFRFTEQCSVMWCKHWMMFLFMPDKLGSCNAFLIRAKWCMFNGSWLEMKWSETKSMPQWQRKWKHSVCFKGERAFTNEPV